MLTLSRSRDGSEAEILGISLPSLKAHRVYTLTYRAQILCFILSFMYSRRRFDQQVVRARRFMFPLRARLTCRASPSSTRADERGGLA